MTTTKGMSPERERIARIIDPEAFARGVILGASADDNDRYQRVLGSLAKADAILALTPSGEVGSEDHIGDANEMMMVPKTPTKAMVRRGAKEISGGSTFNADDRKDIATEVYRAMTLAARGEANAPRDKPD